MLESKQRACCGSIKDKLKFLKTKFVLLFGFRLICDHLKNNDCSNRIRSVYTWMKGWQLHSFDMKIVYTVNTSLSWCLKIIYTYKIQIHADWRDSQTQMYLVTLMVVHTFPPVNMCNCILFGKYVSLRQAKQTST